MDAPIKGGELKARSRRLYTAPSGITYEIRRIVLFDLIGIYGAVPDLQALAGEGSDVSGDRAAKLLATQGPRIAAHFAKIITAGLLSPKVGEKPDEIEVADIPMEDQPALVTAILELSGVNREQAARLRPTEGGADSSGASTSSPSATGADRPIS